jgi:hypothetical protein
MEHPYSKSSKRTPFSHNAASRSLLNLSSKGIFIFQIVIIIINIANSAPFSAPNRSPFPSTPSRAMTILACFGLGSHIKRHTA